MHITILGITGSVGNAVSNAFLDAGHTVTALARNAGRVAPRTGLTIVEGDATKATDLDVVMRGADVVFHGLNLPYPDWDPAMVELTAGVIAAAERAGAMILFPGNVYGLGPDYREPLTESDPHQPVSKKGALRNRLEALLAEAQVPTLIVRAGDFFGGDGESTWMHHLTQGVPEGGAISYPADHGVLHNWAFLPDLARTFVLLAQRRSELERHAVFHFEGHVVDGHTWIDAVRDAVGDPNRRVKAFPWFWFQFARPFMPLVRELFEMRYLWDQPVRMDGSKLRAFLGEVPHTPFAAAVAWDLSQEVREAA